MAQDFSRKMVIVVAKGLPMWQVLNTVAHCSAQLANKMKEPFDTGVSFDTKDGVAHPRNSQYAIVALSADSAELPTLASAVRASGLQHIGFFREMIETNDDAEIVTALAQKTEEQIEYLGVGIFGDKEAVGKLTKKFSLWKG